MIVVQNRITAPAEFAERIEHGFGQQSGLSQNPGFVSFKLLRADQTPDLPEGQVLYVAQTTWENYQSYETWRSSDSFARAHAGGAGPMRASLEIFEVKVEK